MSKTSSARRSALPAGASQALGLTRGLVASVSLVLGSAQAAPFQWAASNGRLARRQALASANGRDGC